MDDVTRKVDQISRVNILVGSAMSAPRPLELKKKLQKITDQWPLALIMFGGALTLVWLAMLIWIPLRLLSAV